MYKQLKTKKSRDKLGLFFVEGEAFVSEIPPDYKIVSYIMSQTFAEGRDISLYESRASCEIIRDSLFGNLADTVTPQGIIAVCEKISYGLNDILQDCSIASVRAAGQNLGFILMGENINDPGNLGTLVRTAAAAGASGAFFTQGSCDIYNSKAIRASAGAILRLPIAVADTSEIFAALKKADMPIFAAHPRGNVLPYELDFRQKFCLLVGSEARGISPFSQEQADFIVRLPMTNATESLNASVAGSILLYEAVRQRI